MEMVEVDSTQQKEKTLLDKLSQTVKIEVIKKDGTREGYDIGKIRTAINKAAERASVRISDGAMLDICADVYCRVLGKHQEAVSVAEMHNIVESALEEFDKEVAASYRNYRNYKQDFVHMLEKFIKNLKELCIWGIKRIQT